MAHRLTLTDAIRRAAPQYGSIHALAKAAGVHHASILRFLRGDQSLRLDHADALAEVLGIEIKPPRGYRKVGT